jgi:hypothetical protein
MLRIEVQVSLSPTASLTVASSWRWATVRPTRLSLSGVVGCDPAMGASPRNTGGEAVKEAIRSPQASTRKEAICMPAATEEEIGFTVQRETAHPWKP